MESISQRCPENISLPNELAATASQTIASTSIAKKRSEESESDVECCESDECSTVPYDDSS